MTDGAGWKRIRLPEATAQGAEEQRPRPANRPGWTYRWLRGGNAAKTATRPRPLDSADGQR